MGNFRSSPRGAPRDASVAGTPLRRLRFLALERIPLEFAPVSPLSFRGPSVARGPGIHNHRLWLWIPGLAAVAPRPE
jgi:hypothetical protein